MRHLFILSFVLVIAATGCSPQLRLERLLNKHPHLQSDKRDTVQLPAQTIIEKQIQIVRDTLTLSAQIDSFIILLPDTNCRKQVRRNLQSKIVQAAAAQRCLDTPLVHTGTIQYTNDTASFTIQYQLTIAQPTANAFDISMHSTGGTLILKYKTVQIRQITAKEKWGYRKEGAGLLIGLILLLLVLWLAFRIYFNSTGGGAIFSALKFLRP